MSALDRGFEPLSGQTKSYKIGICCFSPKHTALRSKCVDRLAWNQDNVSEWSNCSVVSLSSHIKNPTNINQSSVTKITKLWKKSLINEGQLCHQYHQNEQSTLSYFIEQKEKKDQDNYMMLEIQSWLGTGTNMWHGYTG